MRENKVFAEITGAKSTGDLAMVWKSHVSTVYVDLTFKLRSWLMQKYVPLGTECNEN